MSLKKLVRTYIGRDMKSQRVFRKLGLWVVGVGLLFSAIGSASRADMDAPTIVSVSEVIDFLNSEAAKHKLSQDQQSVLKLGQFAKAAFKFKYLCDYCFRLDLRNDLPADQHITAVEGLRRIDASHVAGDITCAIQLSPKWEFKLAIDDLAFIKKNRDIFEKSFGSHSYGWAWVLFQLDEKAKARQVLLDDFAVQYRLIMALDENGTAPGSDPPLTLVQFEQQALEKLLDKKQNNEIADKMQKLRTHLSNLPEVLILTMNDR